MADGSRCGDVVEEASVEACQPCGWIDGGGRKKKEVVEGRKVGGAGVATTRAARGAVRRGERWERTVLRLLKRESSRPTEDVMIQHR